MPELSDRILAHPEHQALPAMERLKMRLKALTTPDELSDFNDSEVLAPGYARHQNQMAAHIRREKPYGRDPQAEIEYRDGELVEKYRSEQQAKKDAQQPQKLRRARQEYTDEFMKARRKFMKREKADEEKRKKEAEAAQAAEDLNSKPQRKALQEAGEEYREEFRRAREDFAKHEAEAAERERVRGEERSAKAKEKAEKAKADADANDAAKKQALDLSVDEYSKELELGREQFSKDQERWDQQARDVEERLRKQQEEKDAKEAEDKRRKAEADEADKLVKQQALQQSRDEYADELQQGRDQFPETQSGWQQQQDELNEKQRKQKEAKDAQIAADEQKKKEAAEADEAAKRDLFQKSRDEYAEELQLGRDQFPKNQRRWEEQDEELNEKLRRQKEEQAAKAEAEAARMKEETEADEAAKRQALLLAQQEHSEELQRGRDQFPKDQERWDQQARDVEERLRKQQKEKEAQEQAEATEREKQLTKSRQESDKQLKEAGARYIRPRENGKFSSGPARLDITDEQWEAAHQEMDEAVSSRDQEQSDQEQLSGIQARIRHGGDVIRRLSSRISRLIPTRTQRNQQSDLRDGEDPAAAIHEQEDAGTVVVDSKVTELSVGVDATPKPEPQAEAHPEKTAPNYEQAVTQFVNQNNINLRGSELQKFVLYVTSNNRSDIEQAYDDFLKATAPEPREMQQTTETGANPIAEAALGMAAMAEQSDPKAQKTEIPTEVTEEMSQILKAGEQNNAEPWYREFVQDTETVKHMQKPGLFRSFSREQMAQFDQIITTSLDRMSDISSYESNPDELLKSASRNLALADAICDSHSSARELLAQKMEDFIRDDFHAMHEMHRYEHIGHDNVISLFSLGNRDKSFYKGILAATLKNKQLHRTELANILGIPEVRALLQQAVLGLEIREAAKAMS